MQRGLAALTKQQEETKAQLRALAAFLGEDPNTVDVDAIFRTLSVAVHAANKASAPARQCTSTKAPPGMARLRR